MSNSIAEMYGYDDVPESFTRRQLVRALQQHGASLADFDREYPLADAYPADAVLAWLGY